MRAALGANPPQTESRPLRDQLGGLSDLLDRVAQSSPARLAVLVFVGVAGLFTLLLWLPWSSHDGRSTTFVDAAFTAASAVTVTGLTVVPTADHWSFTGQLIILVAVQIGGLGTLTMTSLLALAIGRKLGLRSKLVTQNAMNVGRLGEVGSLLRTVAATSIVIEGSLALILTIGFLVAGEPMHTALWHGIFYSVSAFNNGGFTPHSDGLVPYFTDSVHVWLILFPISMGVLIGSLEAGQALGLKPRAKIRAFANIGSEPAMMLTGPVDVTEKLFERSGMKKSDIDLFELNEAFASVVLRYIQAFDIDNAKINVNGGAIALGHPLGATGAMILGTVLDELERTNKETALVTLCIGGGMGTATIIERV